MDDFTNAEKERITQLYGNDFADIKPEDAFLIARWESWKAKLEDEHIKKIEAIKAESDAQLENITRQAEYAMKTLEQLRDSAMARYERASDGQTE